MDADVKVDIIVLGESGVGKSSILLRYAKNIFKVNLVTTSLDAFFKNIEVKGIKARLQMWDTGGQERFRSMVRGYLRKAHGVLLVYDVTNVMSFHRLESWLSELRNINEEAVAVIGRGGRDG